MSDRGVGALARPGEGYDAIAAAVQNQRRHVYFRQVVGEVGSPERRHAREGCLLVGLLAQAERFLALGLGDLQLAVSRKELVVKSL